MNTVLTRPEFDNAVKDALRHFTRTDLLADSKLLGIQVMRQRGLTVVGVQDLRALLTETAETLFSNTRDQKIYRVLELTYFDPAPKQEAAADRLGLSFSTFRRYLATGVGRLAEFLWRVEQDAFQPDCLQQRHSEMATIIDGTRRPDGRRPLSLIVLPFLDFSQEGELGYFVDGVVDSLMTDLARTLPGSFIVSRSTAFSYKGRLVPVRQIGEDLQVRYVLEGSVLADTTHVRINVQLIDAQTDEYLWGERFDKRRRDVLQVQDEIVARLSRGVGIAMLCDDGMRRRIAGEQDNDSVDLAARAGFGCKAWGVHRSY